MGWVASTTLIFQSKRNTDDYHDKIILRSGLDNLLPNVPPHSLIITDNASYHTR